MRHISDLVSLDEFANHPQYALLDLTPELARKLLGLIDVAREIRNRHGTSFDTICFFNWDLQFVNDNDDILWDFEPQEDWPALPDACNPRWEERPSDYDRVHVDENGVYWSAEVDGVRIETPTLDVEIIREAARQEVATAA